MEYIESDLSSLVRTAVLMPYFTMLSVILGSDNNTMCYDDIGCIEISERWYDITRPVNLLPLERYVINTQFILTTRDNLQERILSLSAPESLEAAGFNQTKPVIIIIHGFIDTGFTTWVKDLTNALLEVVDCNVVSVDWGGGSLPLYTQAAANTRIVGLEVAHFINTIVDLYGVEAGRVHIIGHSLGAHAAGYAGERIKGLGRITGLDPAEPLFQGMPGFVRLDPSDATFVDVIHTDVKSIIMGGYGMRQPVGHVDFYPNGGETQPGCSILSFPTLTSISVEDMSLPTPDSVSRYLVACAHNRAIQLFLDSVRRGRTCTMVGHLCSTYQEFKDGGCLECGEEGERCSVLGYHAHKLKGWEEGVSRTMYLETGATDPYCQHNYVVEVELGRGRGAAAWVQGFVYVSLFGDRGEIIRQKVHTDTNEGSQRFTHGDRQTFKLSVDKNIGAVSIVDVEWLYDHELDPFNLEKICFIFCSDSLHVNSVTVTSFIIDKWQEVVSDVSVLCGEEQSPVQSGSTKLFYKNC